MSAAFGGERHQYPVGESHLDHSGGRDCPCKPERRTKTTQRNRQGHRTEVTWVHQATKAASA